MTVTLGHWTRLLLTCVLLPCFATAQISLEARKAGAVGDGRTLDTEAIQKAIDQCSREGGGTVRFTAGEYLTGTLHLRSKVSLHLETGARLAATTNLDLYHTPQIPASMPEARWGKWHRALLVGEGVEDVTISGPGIIDGRKVYDPTGEERRRGPHTIVLVGSKRFVLRDIEIVDSANYALFFQVSDDIEVRNVRFWGGWDGVHFRGSPERWCKNVKIIGCQFYTGDDAIAGRYWDNTLISECVVNSSCNGIRLIGPATRLLISHSIFYGPGEQPHRTSARTNMLSGIILQPGAWDKTQGLLDDVLIANNTMRDVASPVTIWTKPGNPVGKITVAGLQATGVYRAALSVESWSELPITNVIFRSSSIEFAGGGTAEQAKQSVKGPGVDPRPLPGWGVYARNVQSLTLEDVRLSLAKPDARPVLVAEDVQDLTLNNLNYPPTDSGETLITNRVARLHLRPAK